MLFLPGRALLQIHHALDAQLGANFAEDSLPENLGLRARNRNIDTRFEDDFTSSRFQR